MFAVIDLKKNALLRGWGLAFFPDNCDNVFDHSVCSVRRCCGTDGCDQHRTVGGGTGDRRGSRRTGRRRVRSGRNRRERTQPANRRADAANLRAAWDGLRNDPYVGGVGLSGRVGKRPCKKKVWDQQSRVALIRDTENAVLISIHQNNYPDSRPCGSQVLYRAARIWASSHTET